MTGGLGAGKSEALRALAELGAATLSTDEIVRELLQTDDVRDLLVERLGEGIAPEGVVDRGAVATLVFDDPEAREWLERELWPRVGARVAEWRQALSGNEPAAVVEVPLLFESGMDPVFDDTIAVIAPEDLRARRAGARGHQAIQSRESRQLSQEEKAQRADFVVRNDGTLDELKAELSLVLAKIAP